MLSELKELLSKQMKAWKAHHVMYLAERRQSPHFSMRPVLEMELCGSITPTDNATVSLMILWCININLPIRIADTLSCMGVKLGL
jgi:hypothetical protein